MVKFLLTSLIVFAVMVGWLYVQHVYRRFATNNPQLGPFRSEAVCQGSCGCHAGSCTTPAGPNESVEVALPDFSSSRKQMSGVLQHD